MEEKETKPITLKVEETTNKIVNVINDSHLPWYIIKTMLQNIFNEVDKMDREEINKYLSKQAKESEK